MTGETFSVYRAAEWEHGLRCARCEWLFGEGEPFEQVFDAMLDDGTPILLLVCTQCVGTVEGAA